MPKRCYSKILCCFVIAFACKTACAQSATDSARYDVAVNGIVNHFYQGVAEQSRLYNGYIYDSYDSSVKGSPYLDDIDNWRPGSVVYDHQDFAGVSMIYDLYTDQLVVMLFNHASPIALVPEKVSNFDLHDRHFVRINNANIGVKAGYYEQLYGGNSQVLKKVEKTLKSTSNSTGRDRFFVLLHDAPDYYIKKDGTFYKVTNQGTVLDVFADKKKELKQYIKDKHLQFNDFFELALASAAGYYDSLTH